MREELLSIIEKNSRIEITELSVLLGKPEIDVANEIKKLEEEGIICAYHTLIDWEKTYIDCAEALAEKYDYVFLSTHDMAIDELISRGAKFYIVYPKAHCKFEYMQRFKDRGNSQEYIDKFMKNWDSFIARLDRLETNNKVTLRTGQYLSDVIERLR